MLRAIREIQPSWVVGENVRGLTNWNGGLVFDEVQTELEAEGYEVLPFLLPACAVNAPHRRDRIWFIAYSNGIGRIQTERWRNRESIKLDKISETRIATNTNKIGLQSKMENGKLGRGLRFTECNKRNAWHTFPSVPPICGADDGLPKELDGITFSKWRNESIKAYGNAIVPQVAYQIFKSICQYQEL